MLSVTSFSVTFLIVSWTPYPNEKKRLIPVRSFATNVNYILALCFLHSQTSTPAAALSSTPASVSAFTPAPEPAISGPDGEKIAFTSSRLEFPLSQLSIHQAASYSARHMDSTIADSLGANHPNALFHTFSGHNAAQPPPHPDPTTTTLSSSSCSSSPSSSSALASGASSSATPLLALFPAPAPSTNPSLSLLSGVHLSTAGPSATPLPLISDAPRFPGVENFDAIPTSVLTSNAEFLSAVMDSNPLQRLSPEMNARNENLRFPPPMHPLPNLIPTPNSIQSSISITPPNSSQSSIPPLFVGNNENRMLNENSVRRYAYHFFYI